MIKKRRNRCRFTRASRTRRFSTENLESRQLLAVVVSEFMADNATTLTDEDGDSSDWIEIRNTTSNPVNLEGWSLTDSPNNTQRWSFPDRTIGPDEYLLVFASGKDRKVVGQPLHTDFRLSAGGEYLALYQPDGTTTSFAYEPEFPAQSADVSYGLSHDLSVEGFFLLPTPGQRNDVPIQDSARSVVINELMYRLPTPSILDAEDTSLEFIELLNRGHTDVNVGGWQITRGVDFVFPDVNIPAQGMLVVAANLEAFQAVYPTVTNVVGNWQGTLSNRGETLEIVDQTGAIVDQLRYADEGDWAVRTEDRYTPTYSGWVWDANHDGGGHTLELVNSNMSNDNGQNWSSSQALGGTPGAPNSVAAANIAPLIADVHHDPPIPQATDSVTLRALIQDESSASVEVNAHWRSDEAEPFASTPMFDDGLHDDGKANDGLYGVILPGQPDRTVVEFYVTANDAQGMSRSWPAPTDQGLQEVNAIYQVIDDFDDEVSFTAGSPPIYHVIMTPDERVQFDGMNRYFNAQFNATFIAVTGTGIDVRYNAGVRYRGSGSRNDRVPNNRINLPHDNPWQGITAINLNQNNPIDQIAGSTIFRLAGVPAADVHGVRLFGNGIDRKNGGFYAHSETFDSAYAENHFPTDSDGNLYRGRRPNESPPGGGGAGLAYLGQDPAPYVSYIKSTNASAADWSDVIDLTYVLNEATDDVYVEEVRRVIDVDQWFLTFAVNTFISNTEYGLFTGDPLGDDYAMYRGNEDSRFQMVPYDWDTSFRNLNRSIFTPGDVDQLNKLITHPEFLPQFYAAYRDLIQNVILTDDLGPALDAALSGIAPNTQINDIKSFLRNRADVVLNQINDQLVVAADLPVEEGVPRSTTGNYSLSGQVPYAETRAVRVDGELGTIDRGSWASPMSEDQDPLLSLGSAWRYLDDGSDQGVDWRAPNFDDSGWKSGLAQLGYGDGDETTTIEYGGDENNRFVTSYFRTEFTIQDADQLNQIQSLFVRMIYDDGVAVYLNGAEILRAALPTDATASTFADAVRSGESNLETFSLPSSAREQLVVGRNVLAVEVHQANSTSSDVSMDLELGVSSRETMLDPGMNRIAVAAYGDASGATDPVAETTIDIWYDSGQETEITADITNATVWTKADSPYRIRNSVTVDTDAMLIIEPGVTVFFDRDVSLTIRGQLMAVGSADSPIWFTRRPGESSWNGLQFRNSTSDNRIQHAILEHSHTNNGMIGLRDSRLTIEDSQLDHADRRRIRSIDSSLIARNCVFENIFDPDQAPSTDNLSEHIWGRGIPADGEWIVSGNTFGTITGHNDGIDFDSERGVNRYAQIRHNVFLGGGDDALDMTGDVFIEGNIFQNYIKDEFNVDPGESNTISSSAGDFWVVGNVFDNVQHAALVKEGAFMHFLQNTVTGSEFAPLYFDLPGQTSGPGRGANVIGSLFANSATTFDYIQPDTELIVRHSYLAANDEPSFQGNGNRFGNPQVTGYETNYRLEPGSPAANRGPNGVDMGARYGQGATAQILNYMDVTNRTSATILVGGPAITHYRFQVNEGPVSDILAIDEPIVLSDLARGFYKVRVWGRDILGEWQATPTETPTWFVLPALANTVRLNEILADNRQDPSDVANHPDLIELFNMGDDPIDLSGYSLSDQMDDPLRFVFPPETSLPGRSFLVVSATTAASDAPLAADFGLDRAGDSLYLFTPMGTVLDSITFGTQLPNHSIGRDLQGNWRLNEPTLGSDNIFAATGDPAALRINEWFAAGEIRLQDDHLELFNPLDVAVRLDGLSISDEPYHLPQMTTFPELSFIGPQGFIDLVADGNGSRGAQHLDFRLNPFHEHLALIDAEGQWIDQVFYYSQTIDVSQGRVGDGTLNQEFRVLPTLGATNGGSSVGAETVVDFGFDQVWRYDTSGSNSGTAWRMPEFDDSSWESGAGLLGFERVHERPRLPDEMRTIFDLGNVTYYFRTSVDIPSDIDLNQIISTFTTAVDDGFMVYLNGHEILRQGMPNGDIESDTLASRNVDEAELEGPFDVPSEHWVAGENILAVEVHQTSTTSGDMVFGLALNATSPIVDTDQANTARVFESLRITELMYAPRPGEAEYLELQNTGDAVLDLSGIRLTDAIEFEFASGTQLAPGAAIVISDDTANFLATHGVGLNIAGEFRGQLNNDGETITLQLAAPLETAVLRFSYNPEWYASTNSQGDSLSIISPQTAAHFWSDGSRWQATSPSPGRIPGSPVPNDLDGDGRVTSSDIDYVCEGIRENDTDIDFNGDEVVDLRDLEFFVTRRLGTVIGDADLNGVFDSQDFVAVFIAGEYVDAIDGNSTWSEGDWNCDRDFDTEDIVAAFQAGGYATPTARATDSLHRTGLSTMTPKVAAALDIADDGRRESSTVSRNTSHQTSSSTLLRRVELNAVDRVWETAPTEHIDTVAGIHDEVEQSSVRLVDELISKLV